jgi:hypothetical protein
MRALCIAAVFLALSAAGAAAATPLPSAFFKLSRVQVSTHGDSRFFTVSVTHVQPNDGPVLSWSLSPTGGASCEDSGYPGGTRSRNGLVFWDQQGPTFRWDLGSSGRCAGRVSVVAENQYEHCTATVATTPKATTSAAPACALGGYAVGFSTLPVPASVFQAYTRVQAQLSGPPRSAAAAEREIRKALEAQTAAFAVFPSIWFCNFARTFAPIAALSADFARRADAAARRDARTAERALSCAPTAVRQAFATLARSATPQPALLAATLEHYFPTVFGLRYDDLVQGFAVESVALGKAEAATAAGNSGAAEAEIAAVARSVNGLSTGLSRYQAAVVRVENANG